MNFAETESYGKNYGDKADDLLREYYRLALPYWFKTGMKTINVQHYAKYRGCNIAAEIFTNALLITPGNVGTYFAAGGERGRLWITNGIPCMGVKAAYYVGQDELKFLFDFARNGATEIFSYTARPQFWVINVLGNYALPENDEKYYKFIGTDKLFNSGWYRDDIKILFGTIVPIPPSILGKFYKESLNQ